MTTFSTENIKTFNTNNNVLTFKTVQISPFRTLITALKDILLETNITFEPSGIKIINMDKSHTILCHCVLPSHNFEFYECKKEKIIIGVNVLHFFKLISMIDNNDTMTIYVENEDYNDGIVTNLTLRYENGGIKQCRTFKIKLIEPEEEELQYPDVKFSSIINLPSQDFQKIIRDTSSISDKLEIKSVGDELIFRCSGQFAKGEIRRSETEGDMEFSLKPDPSKIIQGEFSLKNLGYFIKCTSLCQQIELFLENDLPLVVKYNVASLGAIRLCLSALPSS